MLFPLSQKISSFQSRISLAFGPVSAGVCRSGMGNADSTCVRTVSRAETKLWRPLQVQVALAARLCLDIFFGKDENSEV